MLDALFALMKRPLNAAKFWRNLAGYLVRTSICIVFNVLSLLLLHRCDEAYSHIVQKIRHNM